MVELVADREVKVKKKRTNSWTVKNFLKLMSDSMGAHLGVSNSEQITDIKVMNNTVVITIGPKPPKYKTVSRRGR